MASDLKTRVFELRARYGYETDAVLAHTMGVSQAYVNLVKIGKREPGRPFIIGALKAFPTLTFDDLFYIVETPEPIRRRGYLIENEEEAEAVAG